MRVLVSSYSLTSKSPGEYKRVKDVEQLKAA